MREQRSVRLKALPSVIAILFLISVASGATQLSSPHLLSGVVTDERGNDIAGATVYAEQKESGIITSGHTDSNGHFEIPVRTAGVHVLTSSKKGFTSTSSKTVELTSSPIEEIRLSLTETPIVPGVQLTSADIIPRLPEQDDPVGQRVAGSCSQCHSISALLWRGGRTKADWAATVERMSRVVGGYFPIQTEHKESYVAYLTKHLGPESSLPTEIGRAVKDERPALPIGTEITYTEYEIPTALALAHTAVPDGRGSVWFASFGAGNVGRLNVETGVITEYNPKTSNLHPHGITVGPDGTVWYTAMPYGIGRINPVTGEMAEFKAPDPTVGSRGTPHTIIVARSGKVWFTELGNQSISNFDPKTGKFERYQLGERGPYGILEHPEEDDVFWFGLSGASKIGYLNANTGEIKTYPTPTEDANPQRIRFDSAGRIWFGEYGAGKIGMFDPATAKMIEYDLPTGGSAYCIHIDDEDNVWVASTRRESLIRFDPETKEMTEYPLPGAGADGEILGAIVRDIWPDEQGRMWFVEWSRNKVASAEYRAM